MTSLDTRLEVLIQRICSERGLDNHVTRASFRDLLGALHETLIKSWSAEEKGIIAQTYWALGDEAAFHLGGILAHFGNDEVGVELEYLDSRIKRFRKILEQWELERDMEIEGNK